MPRAIRTVLIALGIILALYILLTVAFLLGPSPRPTRLPNPNGYDDFVKAGASVTGDTGSFPDLDQNALRELLTTNAEPLRMLRKGLSRRCSAPTDLLITNADVRVSELSTFKRLGQLLAAEGRLAEGEGRYDDAARSYLDALQLGNEISHGGLLINRLVGIAIGRIGYAALLKLAPKLSCEQSKPIIDRLEKIDRSFVRWEDVMQAENKFARFHARKMRNPIVLAMSWWQGRAGKKKTKDRHQKLLSQLRLMSLELALRCYRSEHGVPPKRLEQLGRAQDLLLDPFSDQPLIYQPQGTNWFLYSVGVNGVNDGGKPTQWPLSGSVTTDDLFFDSP